jgi:riboflavin synthase
MFTGLVETVGRVARTTRSGEGAVLTVEGALAGDEVRLGDSIAVNGICLTVVKLEKGLYSFDVSPETVETSTFAAWRPGDAVNLERALRLCDRLGGHLVSGHVDTVAVVEEKRETAGNTCFRFRLLSEKSSRYLVEKGSVAVDGISLTVNSVDGATFTLNVIPHTAEQTNLRFRKVGDRINIETDMIGRYVERLLGTREDNERAKGIDLDFLAKNGFV